MYTVHEFAATRLTIKFDLMSLKMVFQVKFDVHVFPFPITYAQPQSASYIWTTYVLSYKGGEL